ncbi:MAG: hypothetical protein ACSHW0_02660 [Thalassotalea sp.]
MKRLITSLAILSTLASCGNKLAEQPIETPQNKQAFTAGQAKSNLLFAKDQYLKLIDHVESDKNLHKSSACKKDQNLVCFPRAEEFGTIYLEQPKKWTNGFYPGLIWKLLASDESFNILTDAQEQKLKATALMYQYALAPETQRGSTHDLGFILNDSYGEALEYNQLSKSDRSNFNQRLNEGRATLIKRYSDQHKVIKSWDFLPKLRLAYDDKGKSKTETLAISAPWSYPVIVDNMMNLDFLFAGKTNKYDAVAFNHAASTLKNHYFYDDNDSKQARPIAYHLIDYDTMRPGNWQGMGSVSAWARGQAWSFYGFVSVLEAQQNSQYTDNNLPNFEQHLDRLFNSVSYLLAADAVPDWDFFAARSNANEIANNMDATTTAYSRILDLCPSMIEDTILPYHGYSPILIDSSMVTKAALAKIKTLKNHQGNSFIQNDKISACGHEKYDLTERKIPKDTSAAAILAAGMYRYASFVNNPAKTQKMVALADKIMAKLTNEYRTDKAGGKSFDLGFVLTQATGNLPSGSEINTPIVYGDFYFVEANILKLKLAEHQ